MSCGVTTVVLYIGLGPPLEVASTGLYPLSDQVLEAGRRSQCGVGSDRQSGIMRGKDTVTSVEVVGEVRGAVSAWRNEDLGAAGEAGE